MNLKDVAKRVIKLMPELPKEASALVDSVVEPGQLADLIISNLDVQVDEKQDVLETFDLKARLRKVLQFLSRQHEVLKVREKINSQVQEEMGRNQREYVLRQQLKAIKEELGEIDETGGDLDDFREKIVAAKMPPDTEKVAMKQLERLKVMQPSSAEYTVTRTYLEWLVELPWSVSTEDKLDIQEARDILNTDHYDLEKVKKRILEYLAVRKLKSDKKGPILCLVGPPGVGKTSLGRSIARSLGRKFIRISLGGVRDEAEIRGHRRTYVGSLPGRLDPGHEEGRVEQPGVHARRDRQAGARLPRRPGGRAARGARPGAEPHLLRPLPGGPVRPVEGHVRRDGEHHGPGAAGAARPARGPGAARLHARGEAHHLEAVPGAEAARGARPVGREAVRSTTRRSPRSSTATRARPASATWSARSPTSSAPSPCWWPRARRSRPSGSRTSASPSSSARRSTSRRWPSGPRSRASRPGLAWTPVGGDILFIEATKMNGKGQLVLTGQLGDVMKESAQAALSFIRSRAKWLGLEENFLEKTDIHVHIPAGAIPKDGPSAGVTMFVAMASLLTGKPIRNDVAMTGEITLRGLVLPVGGIKEKFLAAHRAGIKRVILPERNRKDVIEIPEQPRKEIEILFVKRMDELLPLVLTEMPKLGVMSAPVLPPPAAAAAARGCLSRPSAHRSSPVPERGSGGGRSRGTRR